VPDENSTQRMEAIDVIKQDVFTRLHNLSKRRVLEDRVREWVVAYEYRGVGSTRLRAKDVFEIYQGAAPVPYGMLGPDANKFLFELRKLISDSVHTAGGSLKGWTEED